MAAATLVASPTPVPHARSPTMPSSPTSPTNPDTLSARINVATRTIHHALNSLITPRLPLALPPHTPTPDLYLHGIHTFAQIYFAFEESWQDLICAHLSSSPAASAHATDVRGYLSTLVDARLWRTQALEADVGHLRTARDVSLPDLEADGKIAQLRERIRQRVEEKPHVLLAYAWVMYMAIFAGGRWIRGQLALAGDEFWRRAEGETDGCGLFYVQGDEEVKVEFKKRFAEADGVLTEEEKGDVVREAGELFKVCIGLVEGLDERFGSVEREGSAERSEVKKTAVKGKEGLSLATPNKNTTERVSPIATVFAVLIGLLGWYLLRSAGFGGQILASIF
ncbi:heme oxygenase-like protein [Myriangium duriaei CBS 260.36]|uniref:Heme oxygenase-like protein n=1 Tax=Myriangium duriaei CBS 260.36 TaxID=1168546 RepID=A0A9P4MC63_9PEZI|nr:heme oxygenase-like protein [Myriangium duriaei CBS 260.36]